MIRYASPRSWVLYDRDKITEPLVGAKSAILSLRSIPYQRAWVDDLQQVELRREVAGTSRIEGAEFTERELEAALRETPEELLTRSQRQAHAAVQTYRWLATIPDERPVNEELICEIHRRIVTGADDDHCPPGQLRQRDQNVNFGTPRHRCVDGGDECRGAFERLSKAIQLDFQGHDPLIQALAAHYHFAAMHPFLDGNGRTARALEALMLQRAGLRDTCFISMSNYYYDEKTAYLAALSEVRTENHDLTAFLVFGLRGVALQTRRLLTEIQHHISKELFRNMTYDLFQRLLSPRKRVIAERQIEILKLLLEADKMTLNELVQRTSSHYVSLKNQRKAVIRDLSALIALKAVKIEEGADKRAWLSVRLEWPTEITETKFFEYITNLPKAKTHKFLE